MLTFFAFIIGLVITMVFIPPLMRASAKLQLIDLPGPRKVHESGIPRVGGIAIIFGVLVPLLLWVPLDSGQQAFLAGITILLVFGILDDRGDLDFRIKFLGQILAVSVVVFWGGVVFERLPFLDDRLPHEIAIPFTIVLLVGITNAINLSDGLDGLAGGTTLLSFGVIALLAHLADDQVVVLIALAVSGAVLGFLRFNTYPARIFMGDTGSQFLGFTVGVLSVMLVHQSNSALSPALPVLILGLPILDTLTVMTQRIYEGSSPFKPDKKHIHHKLLSLGLDHYEAVVIIYIAQALLVASAYFMQYESDLLVLGSYVVFCVGTLVFFQCAPSIRDENAGSRPKGRFFSKWIATFRDSGWAVRGPNIFVGLGIPLFLVGGAYLASSASIDFAIVGLAMFVMLLAACATKQQSFHLIERAGIYVTGAFVIYLLEESTTLDQAVRDAENAFFVILAIATLVGVRFSGRDSFQVTPLDFLVILIALVVPNLPGLQFVSEDIGTIAVKLIVFFYASELILSHKTRGWDFMRIGTLASLGIIAAHGLL